MPLSRQDKRVLAAGSVSRGARTLILLDGPQQRMQHFTMPRKKRVTLPVPTTQQAMPILRAAARSALTNLIGRLVTSEHAQKRALEHACSEMTQHWQCSQPGRLTPD